MVVSEANLRHAVSSAKNISHYYQTTFIGADDPQRSVEFAYAYGLGNFGSLEARIQQAMEQPTVPSDADKPTTTGRNTEPNAAFAFGFGAQPSEMFNELNGFDQPNIADEEDTTMPVGVYTVEHEGVQHQMVLEEVFDSVMQDLGDACEIIEEREEEIQNLSNQLELSKLMEVKVDKAVSVAKQAVSALEALGVSSDLIARLRSELN